MEEKKQMSNVNLYQEIEVDELNGWGSYALGVAVGAGGSLLLLSLNIERSSCENITFKKATLFGSFHNINISIFRFKFFKES
ncbi:hypothetical protein [Streptococcus mutans]|uniref:hypothetical protein n=1 Tax=Streptococcus mutans TaxID=1309 RepID=UPI0002FBD182|nr:hypothetical protein [Streptococcus mutans]